MKRITLCLLSAFVLTAMAQVTDRTGVKDVNGVVADSNGSGNRPYRSEGCEWGGG